MTDEAARVTSSVEASRRSRALLGLGIGLVALSSWRAAPDAAALRSFLISRTPDTRLDLRSVPWSDFAGLAWASWPIVVGLCLIGTRSSRLARPAMILGLAMAAERFLTLIVGGVLDSGWGAIYGRAVPAGPPLIRSVRGLAVLAASAFAWLAIGLSARALSGGARARPGQSESEGERPRGRNLGGLAWFLSVVFAVALFADLAWTSYLEVIARVPRIREFVLRGDRPKPRWTARRETAAMKRAREANDLYRQGMQLQASLAFGDSRRDLIKAFNRYEALARDLPEDADLPGRVAVVAKSLAWLLSTCPDRALRDPIAASELAKLATENEPEDGHAWNTLGVALYYAGRLDDSASAFDRAMELRGGGNSFDWFFLAQIEQSRGRPDKARAWYDRAVAGMSPGMLSSNELNRFHIEAAERLGLPAPALLPLHPAEPAVGGRIRRIGPGILQTVE